MQFPNQIFGLVASVAVAPAALSSLTNLCSLLVLAFLCAGLAHFLDAAQGPGMIFRGWRTFWHRRLWFAGRARITEQRLVNREQHGVTLDVLRAPTFYWPNRTPSLDWIGMVNIWLPTVPWRRGLYKILGGCLYCSSVYTGSFFYFVGASFLGAPFVLMAWAWPLFVGAQYGFIELIFAWSDDNDPKK